MDFRYIVGKITKTYEIWPTPLFCMKIAKGGAGFKTLLLVFGPLGLRVKANFSKKNRIFNVELASTYVKKNSLFLSILATTFQIRKCESIFRFLLLRFFYILWGCSKYYFKILTYIVHEITTADEIWPGLPPWIKISTFLLETADNNFLWFVGSHRLYH